MGRCGEAAAGSEPHAGALSLLQVAGSGSESVVIVKAQEAVVEEGQQRQGQRQEAAQGEEAAKGAFA